MIFQTTVNQFIKDLNIRTQR